MSEGARRRERHQDLTIGWCLGIFAGTLGSISIDRGSWLALLGVGVCFFVMLRRVGSIEQS